MDMLRLWNKTDQGSDPPLQPSCLGAAAKIPTSCHLSFLIYK